MEILAVIEAKNKRLRAYLPSFMHPFMACMTKYCSVHDVPNFANTSDYICAHALETGSDAECNYVECLKEHNDILMLLRTEIENETGSEAAASDSDNKLVLAISIDRLFSLFGRKPITTQTTWEAFIALFTQSQLLQAVQSLPIPALAVGLDGTATKGLASFEENETEDIWSFPDGSTYFEFNQVMHRPVAYTLDSTSGFQAHFGSRLLAGIEDEPAFLENAPDIILKKQNGSIINFASSIPFINGLMYRPSLYDAKLYVTGATDLFRHVSYQYSSVMLLDFTDLGTLTTCGLSDCTLHSVTQNSNQWEVIFSIPEGYSFKGVTSFLSFDGRLMSFEKLHFLSDSSVLLILTDSEIKQMRARDMQLTERFVFNTNHLKITSNTEYWIRAQFNQLSAEMLELAKTELATTTDSWSTMTDEEKEIAATEYAMNWLDSPVITDGANHNRSFFFFIENENIYLHEYMIHSRLNYNSILAQGGMCGILQSVEGKEAFEFVALRYRNRQVLKAVDPEKQNLSYGSDLTVLGYAPYEFLTELNNNSVDSENTQVFVASTPYINRAAEAATIIHNNDFKLLDIVSL